MHILIPQKDLETAATVVSNLVDRTAGPQLILGNVLIDAGEQGIQLRGTDNESFVVVKLSGTVRKPGRTTVPADTFREIVRLMPPQGEVSIAEAGQKVTLSCESSEYKLMTIPAEDFPEWQMEQGSTRFQIAQKTLRYLIDSTLYALPGKDHRRVLLGVYFELGENRLRLTSTDGKKLARVHTDIPEIEGVSSARIIVPRKLLENLYKSLGNEGPVEVELSGQQIAFRFGNVYFRGNGIEGKYPDCDAVIPKDFPYEILLNRDVFQTAARRAGITTEEKNKSIILRFADNACHFTSMAHDLGAFNGRISMDYTGPELELAFNFQFLIETLSRFSKPDVKLFIKSSTAPVVMKAKDEDDRLCLLMPIKLADARPAAPGGEGDDE
ncbi:DNA polymerase III subunit beta [bacterium]|nr:DNA polymerase III subunit beta [bacterium]